jgi:flagellar motor switch protein FliN/FliY
MAFDIQHVMKMEVPVRVRVAVRTMHLAEVITWTPGAIIDLEKDVTDDLEIVVNNKPIGLGSAVKIGENFGIQISYVGDLKSRIKALGGPLTAEVPAEDEDADIDVEDLADQFLAGQQ